MSVPFRINLILSCIEVEGHNLKQSLCPDMRGDIRITARFDLHDGSKGIGINTPFASPFLDLVAPVQDLWCKNVGKSGAAVHNTAMRVDDWLKTECFRRLINHTWLGDKEDDSQNKQPHQCAHYQGIKFDAPQHSQF